MARALEQHRIVHAFRGAEYAFAIPDGDWDALSELIGRCCDVWNGGNSLMIPVTADGQYPPYIESLLETRPVDLVVLHEAVTETAERALRERLPADLVRFHRRLLEHDLHPLNLQPSFQRTAGQPDRLPLPIPAFNDPTLERLALLIWGRIDNDDLGEYGEAFLLEPHEGDSAYTALVDSQVRRTSPIAQSVFQMDIVEQTGPMDVNQLFVLDDDDYERAVFFWNTRSRASTLRGGALVLGLPRAAFATPDRLRLLLEAVAPARFSRAEPNLWVVASEGARDEVGVALEAIGLQKTETDRISFGFGGEPQDDPLTFRIAANPLIGGLLRRGLSADTLVDLAEGANTLRLEPNPSFQIRHGGRVRLDLLRVPHAFPWTNEAAGRALDNARGDGQALSFVTNASMSALHFELRLPTRADALDDFLRAKRLTGKPSQAGRWAQALLARLPAAGGLDVLAQPDAVVVLDILTPLSRKKATQRIEGALRALIGERAPDSADVDAVLREHVVLLELQALMLSEIASRAERRQSDLLPVLRRLVEAEFVQRGAKLACPSCGYEEFHRLVNLDERLNCPACRAMFPYPVADPGDHRELRLHYRLDGLMARAMDQDLLPVLLTLRRFGGPALASLSRAEWPGIELLGDDLVAECDLLMATDGTVRAVEAKRRAEAFDVPAARALVDLADRLDASPILAALDGEYSEEVVKFATAADVMLLGRQELLDLT